MNPARITDRNNPVTQEDITSWQSRLRCVVLETIGEDEVRDILEAIVAKAKSGDLQAERLILTYAVGAPPRDSDSDPPAPRASADRSRTRARPGTREKLDVLAYRHANGLPLHRDDDGEIDLR